MATLTNYNPNESWCDEDRHKAPSSTPPRPLSLQDGTAWCDEDRHKAQYCSNKKNHKIQKLILGIERRESRLAR